MLLRLRFDSRIGRQQQTQQFPWPQVVDLAVLDKKNVLDVWNHANLWEQQGRYVVVPFLSSLEFPTTPISVGTPHYSRLVLVVVFGMPRPFLAQVQLRVRKDLRTSAICFATGPILVEPATVQANLSRL